MDFDKEINRLNTNSLKYDFKVERNKPIDIIPMWVADMDFKCCDEILDAMNKRIEHGIFGYTKEDKRYFDSIYNWFKRNFDTELKQEWLFPMPSVVFALVAALKVLTKENDYVLITNPVFYSFRESIEDNNRKVISSDLVLKDDHYEIDFEDFENKIKEYNIKVFMFCSPHNPVGKVWSQEEINKIISICKKYNVYIISDEVHCDFVWNKKHICMLNNDYKDHVILCTSPTKTFNISGLQIANIFIPDENIRNSFKNEVWKTGYSLLNTMGLVATEAAYDKGQVWLNEVKKYLLENINYLDSFLKERLPKIKLIYPEGTYQLWLDFNQLNLSDEKIEELLVNDAKLWLSSGSSYGTGGKGFQRINIAIPKEQLKVALDRLEKTFKKY